MTPGIDTAKSYAELLTANQPCAIESEEQMDFRN
jgi:hypothetical protein